MAQSDTIVALSTGSLPSGVAIIRVSGPLTKTILQSFCAMVPTPRVAKLLSIHAPDTHEVIDTGLVLFFPSPHSFTGEDCAEFHIHGGRAVVSLLLSQLTFIQGVRIADAGEFTRRAFENGRMDLTEVDGLSDLIASETEAQRRLALSQSSGSLRVLYDSWRHQLIRIRAFVEAEFDFSDEEDVPTDISAEGLSQLKSLITDIENHLDDQNAGEIIKNGFRIALLGKPNSGKSSLLNAFAKRDVAIVTDIAGTTRDAIDVTLDIGGYPVIITDTAGIRDTTDLIEKDGIQRAIARANESDLVIWLSENGIDSIPDYSGETDVIILMSKDDEAQHPSGSISSRTGHGVDQLLSDLLVKIQSRVIGNEDTLITRQRYRDNLVICLQHLQRVLNSDSKNLELRAEELRLAGDYIARITGNIDVENLLDVIFSEFCVGK